MPLQIIRQDITQIVCDAIVNPTDPWFSGSGGADLAIHQAAGSALDDACDALEPLQTGAVAVTPAFRLPCRYVIHTVGPVWQGGDHLEAVLLRSCYLNALLEAHKLGLTSVAFPLISSGTFGFPKDQVLRIATDAVSDFLRTSDGELQVYLCLYDRNAFVLCMESALRAFLEQNRPRFFEVERSDASELRRERSAPLPPPSFSAPAMPPPTQSAPTAEAPLCMDAADFEEELCYQSPIPPPEDLADWIHHQDDSFAVMLLKLIDRKGMTDVECYKKANVKKGTFWKINNDPRYKPSKPTVVAFAIALQLNMDETEALLKTAGFSLSGSYVFDKIIQFYILNGNYDIFEINAALFQYDQACLGC